MSIIIGITEMLDDFESSLDEILFDHKGCDAPSMKNRRSPTTGDHEFNCKCGLNLALPEFGLAMREVWEVAIDQQHRVLAADTYHSNTAGSITLEGGSRSWRRAD